MSMKIFPDGFYLRDWSEMKDLDKFDTAMCNSIARPLFLNKYLLDEKVEISVKSRRMVEWIKLRGIKPTKFEFYDSPFNYSEWVDIDCTKVKKINFCGHFCIDSFEEESWMPLQALFDRFVNLEEIYSEVAAEAFSSIYDDCSFHLKDQVLIKLKSLQFVDSYDGSLDRYVQFCHSLVKLKFKFTYNCAAKQAPFCELLKQNKNLQSLTLWLNSTDGHWVNLLETLNTYCPELTEFQLYRVCKVSLNPLAEIINSKKNVTRFYISGGNSESVGYTVNKTGHKSVSFGDNKGCLSESDLCAFFERVTFGFHDISFDMVENLTDTVLHTVAGNNVQLNSIKLSFTNSFTYVGLRIILEKCVNLRHFALNYCKQITNEQLVELFTIPNKLKDVSLIKISREKSGGVLVSIVQANSNIECLQVTNWIRKEIEELSLYLGESGRQLNLKV